MPVLDIHVHIGNSTQITPWVHQFLVEYMGKDALSFLDRLTPERLDAHFAEQGLDRAVILPEYTPRTTGVIPNEYVAEFCDHSERFIPFGSIDLESTIDTGRQTEDCVTHLGCRGIKLLPSYAHFYPDDPRMYPAYETAAHLGIPVTFHTGTSLFPGSRIRFAHPLLLDDVAQDFPDLNLILAHGGRPFWYAEAEWMLWRHKNTFIDISGIPPGQLPRHFPRLEKFSERFLFGSDWPTEPLVARHIQQVRELPYDAPIIDAILWDNGARVLGLET